MAESFTFSVTCDMRRYAGIEGAFNDSSYFRGACEVIKRFGPGEFMVSPGDIDPPANVRATISQVLGEEYLWYPVVGNHEEETASDMDYLRAYDYDANGDAPPNIVNTGPPGAEETCFSFDFENAHFVAINQYYDGTSDVALDGYISEALYTWLAADLAATSKEHIFVIGHEPAFPRGDEYNNRKRHVGDSLDKYPGNRDLFWDLLDSADVTAYICGHSHNYSTYLVEGVWQIDAGHCRGTGDEGAPSTAMLIHVDEDKVSFDTYRDLHDGTYDYLDIVSSGYIKTPSVITLLPAGSTWKYLSDGIDQFSGWREPRFDDSAWPSGPAELGYGDGDENTVTSDGPNQDEEWNITTYFRTTFPVDNPDLIFSLLVRLKRDDGAVVHINGVEVTRTNMPAGEPGYGTRAIYIMNNSDETDFLTLSVPSSMLVRGKNSIAVEIHQVTEYSDDLSFDLELIAYAEDLTDGDGDGIPIAQEGEGDRDGDGIDNDDDFDPMGYLYDEETGGLLLGGEVSVQGPGRVTLLHDGSEGYYHFTVDSGGVYTLSVTPPDSYHAGEICLPEDATFEPGGLPGLHILGNGEDGSTGNLVSSDCTPFYLQLNIPPGSPTVLGNNIPFHADLPESTTLVSFSAVQNEWDALLSWETGEETGAASFRLFRKSADDTAFTPIGDSLFVGTTDGSGASYSFLNRPPLSGNVLYRLEIQNDGATESIHETVLTDFRAIPVKFALAAVPNPFNAATRIDFAIPEAGTFTLKIYDIRGRLITNLDEGERTIGSYSTEWNGNNKSGEAVPAGVYFCQFRSGRIKMQKKLVLLR